MSEIRIVGSVTPITDKEKRDIQGYLRFYEIPHTIKDGTYNVDIQCMIDSADQWHVMTLFSYADKYSFRFVKGGDENVKAE